MDEMTTDQRRQAVEAILAEDPRTSQRTIAKALGVSQATIRRDMARLRPVSVVTQLDTQPLSGQVSRGAALVTRLRAEMAEQNLIPTSGEVEQLAVAHDLADRIEVLQNLVAVDGERQVDKKTGKVTLHPGLSEMRQCESTLSRVVNSIQTMEQPQVDRTKQRAAQTRWRTKNRQRGLTAAETPAGHGA